MSVLVVVLVAIALISMVSNRRALLEGGRTLPWGAGAVLDVAVPIQKGLSMPFEAIRNTWNNYVALMGVRGENEELREKLARLEEDNLQLREALVASGRLESIAEMRDHFEIPMLPAELVGSDISPWFRSVMLDRGQDDGVLAGMPVIGVHGLVGLVTVSSGRSSQTMLLLDRQSAVDGTVQRSRARGVVRGGGGSNLRFEFVARGGDVQVGDLVITSGLGGVYPKGLRVGEVTKVSDPGSRLLQTATLRPAVDYRQLEQVFVMMHRGPTMDLLYAHADSESDAVERGQPQVAAETDR
jgi:rod shape-determining protein MreC